MKKRAKPKSKPRSRKNRAPKKFKYGSYHDAPKDVKGRIESKIQRRIDEGYDIPVAVAMTYRQFGIKPRKGKR